MLSRDPEKWFDDVARRIAAPDVTRQHALKMFARAVLAVAPLGALGATPARASSRRASTCYDECVKSNNDYNHQFELQCQGNLGPHTDSAEHVVQSLGCMRSKYLLDQEIPDKCTKKCGCPPPQLKCGGVCVDPRTDSQNCGRCGHVCISPSSCQAGHCVQKCAEGETKCGDTCCPKGKICSEGTCCYDCSPGWIKCPVKESSGCNFGCCNPATPVCCPGLHPGSIRCCKQCGSPGVCAK